MKLAKDLGPVKEKAVAVTNAHAQRAREKIVPPGAEYQQKAEEARRFFSYGTGPGDVMILAAEAEIRGVSVAELACLVIERAEAAAPALAKIEIERQRRLAAIAAARSPAEITAVTSEPWPG